MENWKILLLQLREVAKLKGKTINELAEQRKVNQSAISSFFSIKSPPSLATFDEMCNLIGVKLTIGDEISKGIEMSQLKALAEMQLEFIENRNRKINEILDLNDKANDDDDVKNRNRKIDEILDINDKANDDVFKNKK